MHNTYVGLYSFAYAVLLINILIHSHFPRMDHMCHIWASVMVMKVITMIKSQEPCHHKIPQWWKCLSYCTEQPVYHGMECHSLNDPTVGYLVYLRNCSLMTPIACFSFYAHLVVVEGKTPFSATKTISVGG